MYSILFNLFVCSQMILSIKAGESGVITHNLSPGSIICKYSLRSIRTSTAPHFLHPHPKLSFHISLTTCKTIPWVFYPRWSTWSKKLFITLIPISAAGDLIANLQLKDLSRVKQISAFRGTLSVVPLAPAKVTTPLFVLSLTFPYFSPSLSLSLTHTHTFPLPLCYCLFISFLSLFSKTSLHARC